MLFPAVLSLSLSPSRPCPGHTHLSAECVEEAAECPEDEQVAQDDGLNARPLHLDGHLLTTVTQHSLVHLRSDSR